MRWPQKKSLIKITEEGALFQSYIDGSKHLLTPEKSISIQRDIGADLILVFDMATCIVSPYLEIYEPPRGVEPPTQSLRMICSTN